MSWLQLPSAVIFDYYFALFPKGNHISKSMHLSPNNANSKKKRASLVVQMVKNLPAVQETQVQSLGREDPLEEEWQPTP